ncbi:MAG: hypothetical protein KTR30_21500 [Saprospiraceae bacterium]|nr:hypothetical protein [Saprospiraceae bacterium]
MKYSAFFSILLSCGLCAHFLFACAGSNTGPCSQSIWYQDADGDGLGNPALSQKGCDQPSGYVANDSDLDDTNANSKAYTGTAAVTQGLGTKTTENIYPAGQRIAEIGSVTATDKTIWTVPADVNYTNDAFPFAPDLYNPDGPKYRSAAEALAAFDNANMVEIDAGGEIITGYIFGDNYFELYVNGMMVGKDAIPFTQFNSHIVKFKVTLPFSIAMLLVDWEENLGVGTEANRASDYHPGDGGMVAVFKDESGKILATTGSEWKAQTFYTAPIKNLSCPTENGSIRSTANCNSEDASDGRNFYGLHWAVPVNWMKKDFDDSSWPNATTFTNAVIGVDNKPAYTNFTDVFDDAKDDAEFIWSTNVILDNEVIVRYTVK